MRCLHCGKKLSLLKLAKGDSFCSPEHFDAFQLQESKSAFDRLMSLGEPETPKAPLVLKPVQPDVKPVEVKPIAAVGPEPHAAIMGPRPANLEPHPAEVEQAQVIQNKQPVDAPAETKKAEPQAPPCAPFSDQGRPVFFDAPHNIAGGEESENPILPEAQQVTWPVHEVHEAEGILNLHLQLQFAGIEPAARNSKREFVAEDEPFATVVEHPLMDAKPELPEIECIESSEPEAPAAEIDASVPKTETFEAEIEATMAEIEAPTAAATATIEAPLAEGKTPDANPELPQIERLAAPESDASATEVETHLVETEVPAAETEVVAEIEPPAAEIETPLVEAKAPAAELEAPAAELEAPAAELEVVVAKVEPPKAPSIPYLLAPSFLARPGTARFLDPAQTLTVNGFTVPSMLGNREIPGIDARRMPRYTRPVKTAPVATRNFVVCSTATVAELPASPARTLPAGRKNVCGPAWTVSNRLSTIPVRTRNAILLKPRAADFDLPRPASFLVRPDAAAIRALDPQKMACRLDTKSPLRGVLETVPSEAKWTIFQAVGAFDGAVSTILPQRLDQPVSPRFPWKSTTNAFVPECPIAAHRITPASPLPALVYSAPPAHQLPCWTLNADGTPWRFVSDYIPLASRQLDAVLDTRPVAYGAIVQVSTKRPEHAPIQPRTLGSGAVGFLSNWEARVPKPIETRTARFLPVRDVQSFPAARPWPKLGALPR